MTLSRQAIRNARRRQSQLLQQRTAKGTKRSLPAPVGGVNTVTALDAMPPSDAVELINWFPDVGDVTIRKGFTLHEDVGTLSDIETLAEYHSGSKNEMLAADSSSIVEVGSQGTKDAVTFDSSTTLTRGSAYTGISDGKKATVSFWVNSTLGSSDGTIDIFDMTVSGVSRFWVGLGGNATGSNEDRLVIDAFNASGTHILDAETTSFALQDGSWHHVILAFDMATNNDIQVYVDDSQETSLTITTFTNDSVDFTTGEVTIGDRNSASASRDFSVFDLWFDTQKIDLTTEANRRDFVTSGVKPVYLGADGSEPTGSKPIAFHTGDESAFPTNQGTGGGMTENGTLTNASTPYTLQVLVTGLSNGRWDTVNFNGNMLWTNGVDEPRLYNGTGFVDWGGSGSGLTTTNIIGCNVYRSRIYVWEDNSQDVWYGATNAIGGTYTKFPLSRVGDTGGKLSFMATWTRDGGAGADDLAVFVMSTGETLIYQGPDPSAWSLIGIFRIGRPLGNRSWAKVGGDLMIATEEDYVFLSQILEARGRSTKRTKISGKAQSAIRDYGDNTGWQVINYPKGGMLLVNVPVSSTDFDQHVLNTITGAWTVFDGINARSWSLYQGDLYFGGANGKIYKADTGNDDNGNDITATSEQAWTDFGVTTEKQIAQFRPILNVSANQAITAALAYDFESSDRVSQSLTYSASGVNWFTGAGQGTMVSFRLDATANQAVSWLRSEFIIAAGGTR